MTRKEIQNYNFFVVELLHDYFFKINDNKYYSGERFIVFDFDDTHYSIANYGGEYILKKYCKILYNIKFESNEE